jgi:hypothetical protein
LETARVVKKTNSSSDLVHREMLTAVAALVVLFFLSAFFDAPVEGPAELSGLPSEVIKAPWIFLGIQQTLKFLPACLAGIVIPLTALVITLCIPLAAESWGKRLLAAVLAGAVLVTIWGYLS